MNLREQLVGLIPTSLTSISLGLRLYGMFRSSHFAKIAYLVKTLAVSVLRITPLQCSQAQTRHLEIAASKPYEGICRPHKCKCMPNSLEPDQGLK